MCWTIICAGAGIGGLRRRRRAEIIEIGRSRRRSKDRRRKVRIVEGDNFIK